MLEAVHIYASIISGWAEAVRNWARSHIRDADKGNNGDEQFDLMRRFHDWRKFVNDKDKP